MNIRLRAAMGSLLGAVAIATGVAPAAGLAPVAGGPQSQMAGCRLPSFGPGGHYHPVIRPGEFTAQVDNPLFPLRVGTTLVYTGVKDRKRSLDLVHPAHQTRVIDGVRTRVVQDHLFLSGHLEERTRDYYAQDRCGNVWYFGEDTATLGPRGQVLSREGSFHAGVNGAEPGVVMQAQPRLHRRFRQEWYAGHAEDTFRAVQRSAKVGVPYGSFRHALRTAERTALEPAVLDNKWYVSGIGEVEELAVRGPRERLVLVDILS